MSLCSFHGGRNGTGGEHVKAATNGHPSAPAVGAAQLLLQEEQHGLEDIVGDYLALQSKMVGRIGLSEGIVADGAFARQARRKYL